MKTLAELIKEKMVIDELVAERASIIGEIESRKDEVADLMFQLLDNGDLKTINALKDIFANTRNAPSVQVVKIGPPKDIPVRIPNKTARTYMTRATCGIEWDYDKNGRKFWLNKAA